jgi:hypothetical protein
LLSRQPTIHDEFFKLVKIPAAGAHAIALGPMMISAGIKPKIKTVRQNRLFPEINTFNAITFGVRLGVDFSVSCVNSFSRLLMHQIPVATRFL